MERWLSGRKHWFAKPTDVYTSRGFKSRSFSCLSTPGEGLLPT